MEAETEEGFKIISIAGYKNNKRVTQISQGKPRSYDIIDDVEDGIIIPHVNADIDFY